MKIINRNDLALGAIAILLSLITLGFIIYSINFLAANTNQALTPGLPNSEKIPSFNFDGLKKLGIIQ